MTKDARVPGAELARPLPLLGLLLMVLNDHWLRERWPGVVTGKLSDIGVVLYFPFLLTATYSALLWILNTALGRIWLNRPMPGYGLTRKRLAAAMAVTVVGLVSINLSLLCRDLYTGLLSTLDILNTFDEFRYTADPSDCLALLLLPVVWFSARFS